MNGFRLDMDLDFSYTDESGTVTRGTAQAGGSEVRIAVDGLQSFVSGGMPSLDDIRPLAKTLADRGLSVVVDGPDGPIVSLGAVASPASQRLITRSPHIKLGKLGALAPLMKRGRRSPRFSLLPPQTPLPLMPTVRRSIVRRATTTHHSRGSGRPRLIFVQDSVTWNGQVPREYTLSREIVRIGSDGSSDVQLDGLEGLHAEIVHNADDEYVLVPHGKVTGSVASTGESVLRTGARIQMGSAAAAAANSPIRHRSLTRGQEPRNGTDRGASADCRLLRSGGRRIPSHVLGIHDPVGIALLGQEPLALRREVLVERVPRHQ